MIFGAGHAKAPRLSAAIVGPKMRFTPAFNYTIRLILVRTFHYEVHTGNYSSSLKLNY
jgi:hypothetical protein